VPIIVSRGGRDARKIERKSFESEDELQRYIHDNPDVIPLYELKEDVRLLIAAREFPTESGPIDAVGIDKDGELYLIETKLYRNTDKRHVIAQVLDYGASLWRHYAGFEEFTAELERQAQAKFHMGFRQKLAEFFTLAEEEVSSLVETLRGNLASGSFRFVVLMDQLHSQLKDLILFLNQYSKFDIFAVEIEYYRDDNYDYEIVIPKLFGAEIKKDVAVVSSSGDRRRWDEASFLEDAKSKLSAQDLELVEKVYAFSKQHADKVEWGTGKLNGSFNAKFAGVSNKSLYSIYSDGWVELNIGWLNDLPQSKRCRAVFVQELGRIPGLTVGADTFSRRISISTWGPVVETFFAAVMKTVSAAAERTPVA
jgi:hypothetical protein